MFSRLSFKTILQHRIGNGIAWLEFKGGICHRNCAVNLDSKLGTDLHRYRYFVRPGTHFPSPSRGFSLIVGAANGPSKHSGGGIVRFGSYKLSFDTAIAAEPQWPY